MLASTTRDVLRILGMRQPERIGAAAHAVIAQGHSAAHRAAELEGYLREACAATSIPTSAGAAS
jgi:hypothetical protein